MTTLPADDSTRLSGEPTKPGARLRAPERREQLMEVGRRVFAERGFHESKMTDIGLAAGVTKPVLYQHFASKRDLYGAILEDVGDRLETAVFAAATAESSPRSQVAKGLGAFVRFVEKNPDGFQMLIASAASSDSDFQTTALAWRRSMADRIAELIVVDGMSREHQRALADGIVGLAQGMVISWLAEPDHPLALEQLAEDLFSLAWSGLRGLQPTTLE